MAFTVKSINNDQNFFVFLTFRLPSEDFIRRTKKTVSAAGLQCAKNRMKKCFHSSDKDFRWKSNNQKYKTFLIIINEFSRESTIDH